MLREIVIAAIEQRMGPVVGSPEYLADPVKLARAEKRRRDAAEGYADAIIPIILEAAAKVAENKMREWHWAPTSSEAAATIATAIRGIGEKRERG